MKEPLVSIIMPVYNCQKYLSEAIESVLGQTYSNWELVIIDDASTDKSRNICEKYVQTDNKIYLLKNESEIHGPGTVRNIGLKKAKGELIYFMDADDWIEDSLLQKAVDNMQKTKADIVKFGFANEYFNRKLNSEKYIWKGKNIITKKDIENEFFYYWKQDQKSLWLHVFRRDVIKNIKFEEILNGEDINFVMDALSNAEKISYIPEVLYHYRVIEGSISHQWIKDIVKYRCKIWQHQKRFLDSFPEKLDKTIYAEVAVDNYIWGIYQLSLSYCPLSYLEKRKELKMLGKEINIKKYRRACVIKNKNKMEMIKYGAVKWHLEGIILLAGPIFLKTVRG